MSLPELTPAGHETPTLSSRRARLKSLRSKIDSLKEQPQCKEAFLDHANLSTTSRYLNIAIQGTHAA